MKSLATLTAATVLLSSAAVAEPLAVVGSWSSLPLHREFETPFWTRILPEASGGRIEVSLTTHDQMNIGVGDVFRLLGDGVYDVAMTVSDYAVADAPELEGLDVPLVALDADAARAMVDAARPLVEEIFASRFNSHVLAIVPYGPQVVFCKGPVASLDDLVGKKVRASGRMAALLLEGLGAEGVTISFAEVPGALQRGVIDCAVTGAGSGYRAGWWEVSTHLLPIPLGGWDFVVTAINRNRWNALDNELQQLITTRIRSDFEEPVWTFVRNSFENDIACLTGKGNCASGEARSMVLVAVPEADFQRSREILMTRVLPDWAERAGHDWAERWNETVGQVVGVTIAR